MIKNWNQFNENIKLTKSSGSNYKIIDNKKIIGIVELIFEKADEEDYPIEGSYVNIVGLQIFPEFRGNGYSNLFIEKLIDICKSKNIENIVLDAEKSNIIANTLYKKYFKIYKTDITHNHYFLRIK